MAMSIAMHIAVSMNTARREARTMMLDMVIVLLLETGKSMAMLIAI